MSEPEQLPSPLDEPAGEDISLAGLGDPIAPDFPVRQLARELQAARGVRRHLRAIRGLLGMLLFLALMYTITLTKALLIPLVLAAFLGLALNPLVAAGTRIHLPRWLTASVLMVGLIVGTYSSVIVATPLLTYFHEKWPMSRVKKEKVERAPEDSGAVV